MRKLLWVLDHPATGVYGTPVVIAAGFYLAVVGPEWWHDFFMDHALEFLFFFWAGSGFAYMWWMVRKSAGGLPGGQVTAGLVGIVAIVLVTGFGVFSDLYLFGVVIWPGLMLLVPALYERLSPDRETGRELEGER